MTLTVDQMVRELGPRTPRWEQNVWVTWIREVNVAAGATSFDEAVARTYEAHKLLQDEENCLAEAVEGHALSRYHINVGREQYGHLLRLLDRVLASPFALWWLGFDKGDNKLVLTYLRGHLARAVETERFREIVEVYVRRRVNKAVEQHAAALKAIPPVIP